MAQDLMSRRAYGVSVSLDPALRVLIRTEGIGNLQVFSQGAEQSHRGLGEAPGEYPENINI